MSQRIEALITPGVLRWARESIRMEAHEAADRIGVSPDRLADWEDGVDAPSVAQVRKAAEVYKRPLATFYLSTPPLDFRVPHDFRRLPADASADLSPAFMLELRRIKYHRAGAVELTVDEGDDRPSAIASAIGSVSPSADPAQVADRVRAMLAITLEQQLAWKTEYDAINAWKNAIEATGILVFHFERVAVDEARGLSIAELPFPVIAINAKDGPRARMFSLLHEFAHLLINEGGICDTAERRQVRKPDDRVEAFCNAVAGASLVPSAALAAHPILRAHTGSDTWDPRELRALADAFKVSQEVILRRLLAMGRTTHDFYDKRREELGQRRRAKKPGARVSVPRRVLRRVG